MSTSSTMQQSTSMNNNSTPNPNPNKISNKISNSTNIRNTKIRIILQYLHTGV